MFNVSEVICTLSDVVRLAILLLIHAQLVDFASRPDIKGFENTDFCHVFLMYRKF